jgi:hypothetical protein
MLWYLEDAYTTYIKFIKRDYKGKKVGDLIYVKGHSWKEIWKKGR